MAGLAGACAASVDDAGPSGAIPHVESVVVESPPGVARPPFRFTPDDEALLDEVQQGAFWFLWHAHDPATGMVVDRSSKPVVSVAGVGFQLAALPVGVERGWISREQGEERALRILRSLERSPRKAGLFYHFIDGETAGIPDQSPEGTVSTIDSALLFAGMLVAGSYFGGEVGGIGDRLVSEADWRFFTTDEPAPHEPEMAGFVSLGWKPRDLADPTGDGRLLPYYWIDSGDEHRLVTFLAVAAPRPEHRLDPALYYRLRRQLGEHEDSGVFSFFPWSGALFTNFFAHVFLDYAAMGPDDPKTQGVDRRPRVDWWENSRRAVAMHRRKAAENPKGFRGFGDGGTGGWGLTASDVAGGYGVPGLYPEPIEVEGTRPRVDYATVEATDNWGDGTLAPYGAGCAVMFDPTAAVAALRYYRGLVDDNGKPLVWRDFGEGGIGGGYGFLDSFNLGTGWVASDYVAIDQGPLVLAIENARTGLVWDLFHAHPLVQKGVERLGLRRDRVSNRVSERPEGRKSDAE